MIQDTRPDPKNEAIHGATVMKETTPELLAELVKVGWFKEPHLSVLVRTDFRCEYCGQDLLASFNDCFNAQLDHIHPKSKGGSDEKSNLAACAQRAIR